MSDYYIGTSGWHYKHWKEVFYPVDTPTQKWLQYYSGRFNTVEINNSFYRLPPENSFKLWNAGTQSGFKFSVKVSRAITHIKRLKNCEEYLSNLLNRALPLRNKIDVLLYQLPPGMKKNEEILESFLQNIPGDYKNVFEFRNRSWIDDPVFTLLEKYKAGFCIYDMPEYTTPVISISGITYIRFHGSRGLYSSRYTYQEMKKWAKDIRQTAGNLKNVYIYFNNDMEAAAIYNAEEIKKLLNE